MSKIRMFAGAAAIAAMFLMTGCPEDKATTPPKPATNNTTPPATTNNAGK